MMSSGLKRTLLLRAISSLKVPLLFTCSPRIEKLDELSSVAVIPLRFMTKNHVGSMYFGALAMGAELSVAMPIVFDIFQDKKPLTFLFTEFHCEFLKKAKEDIYFVFDEMPAMNKLKAEVLEKGGAQSGYFSGAAYLKSNYATKKDPVIKFRIGVNLKNTKK